MKDDSGGIIMKDDCIKQQQGSDVLQIASRWRLEHAMPGLGMLLFEIPQGS